MSGQARHDSQPINWVLPPGMSNRAFSGVIRYRLGFSVYFQSTLQKILKTAFFSLDEVYHSIKL